jgi:type III secretory pathway component EscS
MIDSVLFIGAIIIAVTQALKILWPKVITGAVTIIVALIVGIAVALLDTHIGVQDITVAQGILIALAAVGVHTTASKNT